MQYLRVLVIVVLTPVALHGRPRGARRAVRARVRRSGGLLLTLTVAPVGVLASRRLNLPSLIGPMVIAAQMLPRARRDGGHRLVRAAVKAVSESRSPKLRSVRHGNHPTRLPLAPLAKPPAHRGPMPVVPRGFDEHPPFTKVKDPAYQTKGHDLIWQEVDAVIKAGGWADTTFILAVQALRVFVMILLAPLAVRRVVAAARPAAASARTRRGRRP